MIFKSFLFILSIYGVSCVPTSNGTQAKNKCAVLYNLSKNFTEINHFMQHGEFPAGKENAKCFWKCFVEEMDMFDSNFNPDKEKMKAIAAKYQNDTAVQLLMSEKFLQSCMQPKGSSPCDKAYNFMKCYSEVKRHPNSDFPDSDFPYVLLSVSLFCVSICLAIVFFYIFVKKRTHKNMIKLSKVPIYKE